MIPLAHWADGQLAALAKASGSAEIATLTGSRLLAERATINDFAVPDDVSAGGGCRLYRTLDGTIALNLSRQDDIDLLPALFACENADPASVNSMCANRNEAALVARGREMGLAIAGVSEDRSAASLAVEAFASNHANTRPSRLPQILDLSALWAGPLAGRLLAMTGGEVMKLESSARPDTMREGDAVLFERLNAAKHQVAHNLRSDDGIAALRAEIAQADIIIESARPRALLQMGIDAEAEVRARPRLIWLTITGHGVRGDAANWIGFGDDAAVAGGLTAALHRATGNTGFVGDAIADPLTGILAARTAWHAWASGQGGRFVFSMSGVVAQALADEAVRNPLALDQAFKGWAGLSGRAFPR